MKLRTYTQGQIKTIIEENVEMARVSASCSLGSFSGFWVFRTEWIFDEFGYALEERMGKWDPALQSFAFETFFKHIVKECRLFHRGAFIFSDIQGFSKYAFSANAFADWLRKNKRGTVVETGAYRNPNTRRTVNTWIYTRNPRYDR